jgi:ubiquinone/menaquinone biosynthesis C-methylase UbiE
VNNPVFDAAAAYQRTAALVAAVKLNIFTTIGSGALGPDELASRTGASSRGVRILCDFLTVMELLKKEDAKYSLMPNARILLDGSSPFAMGSIVDFVAAPEMVRLFLEDPPSYVRRGGLDGASNVDPDNPIWVRYARAMIPFAAATAKRVAAYVAKLQNRPTSVLDVAAGHGLYGIEVARALPDAKVTAMDWENVLEVARIHAADAGIGHRFRTLAGNALVLDWEKDFDLILLPNFLHHFDAETCTSLLRKVKASLSPRGRAVAGDFVPNEDRVSPPVPAMFAFWMLATTPCGDAYTPGEYDEMARAAGFQSATTTPLLPTPQSLVVFN